jgi:hypothetical protein
VKLTRAGTFLYNPNDGIMIAGWKFDMEGAPPPDDSQVLLMILAHIGTVGGLGVEQAGAPTAVQQTMDVIERARKAGL